MDEKLIEAAKAARSRAYVRYSGFLVGAAVLDEHGNIHVGCNVENVAFADTLCAESGAISAMVVAGGGRIQAIAIVGGKTEQALTCMPCGSCRQRIREFSTAATRIIVLDAATGQPVSHSIKDLLPMAYESNAT